jgi:hypothetical protein
VLADTDILILNEAQYHNEIFGHVVIVNWAFMSNEMKVVFYELTMCGMMQASSNLPGFSLQ